MSGGKGNAIDDFAKLLQGAGKAHVKVQSCWAIVKAVDWGNKTMTATGQTDGLDYFEVQLGLGSLYRKPKKGTMCLIGMIENRDAAAFLIDAEEVEEYSLRVDKNEFEINSGGFLIKKENETLRSLMLDLLSAIKAMKFSTNAGPTITLLNRATFEGIENRFKDFLKAN